MVEQPICPECKTGDHIVVEVEMSGSMIIPVVDGKKINIEQYFIGDTWEAVVCTKCNKTLEDEDSLELEEDYE